MGTNYYAGFNCCKHCKRYDKHHIGKSSAGWTFTFHVIDEYDGLKISSYKDWLKHLKQEEIKIFNEYDDEVKLEDFKSMVKNKKKEKNNHALLHGGFLDADGHGFNKGWFS